MVTLSCVLQEELVVIHAITVENMLEIVSTLK